MLMQRLADGDRFAHPAHHIRIDIHALDRPEQAVFAVQNQQPAALQQSKRSNDLLQPGLFCHSSISPTLFLKVHHKSLYNVKIPDAFCAASADPGRKVPAVAKAVINAFALGQGSVTRSRRCQIGCSARPNDNFGYPCAA
jgi:hypothetical protein